MRDKATSSFNGSGPACACRLKICRAAFAGVAKVVKVGKGVSSLQEGQRVVGIPWTGLYGTWQQYRTMPAESLVSLEQI